ncbi:MAG: hypothetical protein J6X66_11335 [Lachnospiraceae bacterium]|nr:hypothetical protein [Lachnospiraceae bacterium]
MNERNGSEDKRLREFAALSEIAIANKIAAITLTVTCSILTAAYVLEVAKGSRTVGYIIITALLAMIPVIAVWICYNANKDSGVIKYITAIGFTLLYTFLVFTAKNDLVFTYIILMLIVITLYNDKKLTTMMGIAAVVEVIAAAVINLKNAEDAKAQLATVEIQILLMLLVVLYLIAVSGGTTKFQEIRMARLALEQNKANEMT